jgi:toxin ParE2
MKIKLLQEAQIELDEAIEFYNQEFPGLGDRFLQEVLNSFDRIAKHKDAWHPLSNNIRRCQTRKFPYGVIYTEVDEMILVLAISNLHRKPEHWKNRL